MSHPRVTDQTRLEVIEAAHWQCQFPGCYRSASEVAHCIAKTEANASMVRRMWRESYGEDVTLAWAWSHIIHSRFNLRASCREHNPYFNCGNHPGEVWEVLDKIYKEERRSLKAG
jgi:hypothetical protein